MMIFIKIFCDYLNQILNYIVFIGAIGLAFIAFVPIFFNGVFNADVSFGGTSIIIIVGVERKSNSSNKYNVV